jgi:hypothetical protein
MGKERIKTTAAKGRPKSPGISTRSARQQQKALLGSLRGKGRMLVSESEFLRPSSDYVTWSVLKGKAKVHTSAV